MTRRDKCYLVGKRAALLTDAESQLAWNILASKIEALGGRDVPKFLDLLRAVRRATLVAKGWDEAIGGAESEFLARMARAHRRDVKGAI